MGWQEDRHGQVRGKSGESQGELEAGRVASSCLQHAQAMQARITTIPDTSPYFAPARGWRAGCGWGSPHPTTSNPCTAKHALRTHTPPTRPNGLNSPSSSITHQACARRHRYPPCWRCRRGRCPRRVTSPPQIEGQAGTPRRQSTAVERRGEGPAAGVDVSPRPNFRSLTPLLNS